MSKITPYDWQLKDQETLMENNYTAICSIEPGGGKTILGTLAIANSQPRRTLIIAPLGTHESAWKHTIQNMLNREVRQIGNSNKAQRQAMADFEWDEPGIYIITPQLFARSDVSMWAGDMVIVDEVHQLLAPQSRGQKNLSGYSKLDSPISHRFTHRLALSGTILRNKFENAWGLSRFVWPELSERGEIGDENLWRWKTERMKSKQIITGRDQRTGALKRATQWTEEKEPGLLFSQAPCVIQHFRRRECCEFHPNGFLDVAKPQEIHYTVPLAAKQKKAIKELEEHYMTWIDENPLATDLAMTQKQRIRQICLAVPDLEYYEDYNKEGELETKVTLNFTEDSPSPFYDRFKEMLLSFEETEPITVFLESQRFAQALTAKLNRDGISAFEYSGKTTKDREQNLAEFGTKYQVAVVVISAGGTGLDGLQRVSTTEVWFERHVDPTLNTQAEARLDRMGLTRQVQRYILKDDMGYADGRLSDQLEKMLKLRQSTTV